jgi:hypothetical protein
MTSKRWQETALHHLGRVGLVRLKCQSSQQRNTKPQWVCQCLLKQRLLVLVNGLGDEFEQTMPDRTSQLLNERILRKTEQLQKDKDMTFNEALFAAGAAVLSAPGGGGMKWAGEGLKAFGQTMVAGQEGYSHVVRILLTRPTSILHRPKVLGIKANLPPLIKQKPKPLTGLHRAEPWRKAMRRLLFSGFNAQVTAAKAPYEIAESQSKAKYQSAYAKLLESGGPGAATAAAKANGPARALTLAR